MNLDFYLEPPELTQQATLKIEALAPLSMVVSQPGTYYRSAHQPSQPMVLGLLENAMGLHLDTDTRKDLLKGLTKVIKKAEGKKSSWREHPWFTGKGNFSGSGFYSFLQHHVNIQSIQAPSTFEAYDDLCSFHFRTDASTLVGGSRGYDYRMESLVSKSRQKPAKVEFSDGAVHLKLSPEELLEIEEKWEKEDKLKINTKSVHYYYPRYYVSPKVRGYVIPKAPYQIELLTTDSLAQILKSALQSPQAPLYLGTNDSWVDVTWIDHERTQ